MCCLFGMIDVSRKFSAEEKNRILNILSIACEVRGTDATGVAYNSRGKLRVYKRPVPAHQLRLRIPQDAKVIMGHTRMTTQGNEKINRNNHPFTSDVLDFALAHNGMLYNDRDLRRKLSLPQTPIETDSYIAVQLIEQQKALNFNSLRYMAEKVEGSFVFTLLDKHDNLHFVKGNNPMCLYHFPKEGFYLYASTKEILDTALKAAQLSHLKHERIEMQDGEIVQLSADGTISRSTFAMPQRLHTWYYSSFLPPKTRTKPVRSEYRQQLLNFGAEMGIAPAKLNYLDRIGISDLDLENAILDDDFMLECLLMMGYYDGEDWYNERVAGYAW